MVQIAVMGYGVVGSGVVEVLTTHTDHIAKRAKEEIGIKYILDLREFPDSPFADKFTKSFDDIINDPEVRVVVEVMGGLHPAFEYSMRCMEAGKSVVTSNKELVATKGAELLKVAQEKNVNFLFEASVGGGIPIIRPISQCLAANDVIEIAGILNGTTNFILTKMIHDSMDFQDALALAQKLGYAERNPAADVEGADALPEDLYFGFSGVRTPCVSGASPHGGHYQYFARRMSSMLSSWGGVVKLIGRVKQMDEREASDHCMPDVYSARKPACQCGRRI